MEMGRGFRLAHLAMITRGRRIVRHDEVRSHESGSLHADWNNFVYHPETHHRLALLQNPQKINEIGEASSPAHGLRT
jgi:hypothetical protein